MAVNAKSINKEDAALVEEREIKLKIEFYGNVFDVQADDSICADPAELIARLEEELSTGEINEADVVTIINDYFNRKST